MKFISPTIKGLITAGLMIASSLYLFYGAGLLPNGRNQYIPLTIYVAGIVWSLLAFKNNVSEYQPFKRYFSEGFKTFIVVTFFMAVYTFFFYKLNTQILENTIVENNALILKEGDHTPAEIAANSDKLRDIFMPMMITINTIKYLFTGALVTVIGAALLSQKK